MSARRYGPQDGQPTKMTEYHQSKDELAGLPVTVTEKIPVTNTPNIFSYKSYIFAKNPALVQRYIKATKADVGGVGGHVVAADEVKSIIAKYVLDNNSYRGEPIFTSMIVTHTGDDCAVTGIMAETVDMSVVDELMWDALQEGATKAAELGLYGPGQDLVADAFTGNLRGAGPATVALPFPVRKDNASLRHRRLHAAAVQHRSRHRRLQDEARLRLRDRRPGHEGAGGRGGRAPA